jgi:hypothetical protein
MNSGIVDTYAGACMGYPYLFGYKIKALTESFKSIQESNKIK